MRAITVQAIWCEKRAEVRTEDDTAGDDSSSMPRVVTFESIVNSLPYVIESIADLNFRLPI